MSSREGQGGHPRWYNRLAAWLCERLHGLAMPAWRDDEADEERAWREAGREDEMVRDLLAQGYAEGWADAERDLL